MSSIGFRINNNFQRPNKELIEAFNGLSVANIADCMNRLTCLDSSIRPFNNVPLLGCAFPIKCEGGDNLMFHKGLHMAQPGDVLVIAGGGAMNRSYCGEIMVKFAMSRGLSGFIIDGCIRDCDEIAKLPFPVYARGVSPNGPYKNGPGEIGYPVSCGGQVIFPGDILIGDSDGIVVIHPEDAKQIAEEAKKVAEKEAKILEDIEMGKGMDGEWIDRALKEKGCLIV